MSFTGIHQGDAASFQERYQRVWKEFLKLLKEIYKQLSDKEAQLNQQSQEDFLLIEQNKVVAGRVGDDFVDNTTPEYWSELKNAIYTPEGEVAEGSGKAKQVVLNGEIVLQSDDAGKILINRVFENERILEALGVNKSLVNKQKAVPDPWNSAGFSESNTDDSWMYESDEYDIPLSEQADFFASMDDFQDLDDQLDQSSKTSSDWLLNELSGSQSGDNVITDLSSSSSSTQDNDGQSPAKGYRQSQNYLQELRQAIDKKDNQALQDLLKFLPQQAKTEAFSQLSDSEKLQAMDLATIQIQEREPVINADINSTADQSVNADILARLAQSVQALSEVVQAQTSPYLQQMQAAQTNPALNVSPELQDAIQQRLTQPNDRNWWQNFKEKAVNVFHSIRDFHQQYSAAQAIKKLYDDNDMASSLAGVYETEDYTVHKQGNHYSLANKSGDVVLDFQAVTPNLIILDREKTNLSNQDKQHLSQLSSRQAVQAEPAGAFAAPGTKEADHLERVNNIISTISQAAVRSNQTISVEGKKFGYKWEANVDGSVKILKTEGASEKILLMKGSKGQYSDMSPRDLLHFEKMLPTIEKMGQQTSKDSTTKGVER